MASNIDKVVVKAEDPAQLIKRVRKQAFKEAAEYLRANAADLEQARQSVINSSPKFVQETASFKMETRSILERVQVLRGQAGYIEAME